jgi:hypothetical protein
MDITFTCIFSGLRVANFFYTPIGEKQALAMYRVKIVSELATLVLKSLASFFLQIASVNGPLIRASNDISFQIKQWSKHSGTRAK